MSANKPNTTLPAGNPGNSTMEAEPAARSRLGLAVGFYLLTRIIVVAAAILAPQHRDRPQFSWWPANPLIRWDAGHYWGILVNGYPLEINDTTAFFPLYPLTAWPVWKSIQALDRWTTGHDYSGPPDSPRNAFASELALVITSHGMALAALIVFYRWCAKLAGDAAALRASALLSAFPTAMYFSVGYAEGLFVLCVAFALWWVLTNRPWLACLACAAATATRPTGIVLSAVILLMILGQEISRYFAAADSAKDRSRIGRAMRGLRSVPIRRWARLYVLGCLSISGLALHTWYLGHHYGRYDAYFESQKRWAPPPNEERTWSRALTLQPVLEPAFKPIKYAIRGQFDKLADARTWNLLTNLIMVVLAVCALRRPGAIPRAAFLLTILVFLLAYQDDPFSGGRLLGIARYHLIGLPVFLWVATRSWLRQSRVRIVCLCAAMLLLQCFYVRGYVDWILVS